MSPTERKFYIKRALLHSLAEGRGPVPEQAVATCVRIKLDFLKPTHAEIDSAIQAAAEAKLITGAPTDIGTVYQLSVTGQLWIAENP